MLWKFKPLYYMRMQLMIQNDPLVAENTTERKTTENDSTRFSVWYFTRSLFIAYRPLGQNRSLQKEMQRKEHDGASKRNFPIMGQKETIIFLINHNKLKELEIVDMYNLLSLNPSLIAKNSPGQVRKKNWNTHLPGPNHLPMKSQ